MIPNVSSAKSSQCRKSYSVHFFGVLIFHGMPVTITTASKVSEMRQKIFGRSYLIYRNWIKESKNHEYLCIRGSKCKIGRNLL